MKEDDSSGLSKRISDDDVQRLLKRAAELDAARSTTLTLRDLQEIAQDASITPEAINQAWAELQQRSLAPTSSRNNATGAKPRSFLERLRHRASDWATQIALALQTSGVALLSFAVGYLTAPDYPGGRPLTPTVAVTLAALVIASLALAIAKRSGRDHSRFQTLLLALWLFYWYGTLNGAPSVPDYYFFSLHGSLWASLALIGRIIVQRGPRTPADTLDSDQHLAA